MRVLVVTVFGYEAMDLWQHFLMVFRVRFF